MPLAVVFSGFCLVVDDVPNFLASFYWHFLYCKENTIFSSVFSMRYKFAHTFKVFRENTNAFFLASRNEGKDTSCFNKLFGLLLRERV